MNKVSTAQIGAGVAILGLGSLVLTGWITHTPLLVQMHADLVGMVINTSLCFLLLGIAFLLPILNYNKTATLQSAIGFIVLVVGTIVLFENLFGIDLGIDLQGFHSWLSDGNPHPGRMAPNTAVGFMLAGLVLVLQRSPSKSTTLLIQIATFAVLMLGLTGLVGYTLQLDLLYSWFKATRMALHTAFGMTIVAFGLWGGWRQAQWYQSRQYFQEDEQIAIIGAALLVVIALTTGIAGFAAQQSNLEKFLVTRLSIVLKYETTIFRSAMQLGGIRAQAVATRPDLLRLTAALGRNPTDEVSQEALESLGVSILTSGMSGILILDPSKRELLRLGKFIDNPSIRVPLNQPSPSLLLSDRTLLLNTELPLSDSTGTIGTLILEEPFRLIATPLAKGEGLGHTGEMVMCFPNPGTRDKVTCFPQIRNPQVFQASRISKNGMPTPMSYAVDGKSGTIKALDYRGHNVIATYGPLTNTGLGIVVKQDTHELLEPVRLQLQWAAPLLLLLVTLGAVLLRSQLRPLASRLLRSEREANNKEIQIRTVNSLLEAENEQKTHAQKLLSESEYRLKYALEGAGDGVWDWNYQSGEVHYSARWKSLLGYGETEIQNLFSEWERLVHPDDRERATLCISDYVNGKSNSYAQEIRMLHKEGHWIWILTRGMIVERTEEGAPLRILGTHSDVTRQKTLEHNLNESENRFRLSFDYAAIGMALVGLDGQWLKVNKNLCQMLGMKQKELLALTFQDITHPDDLELDLKHLNELLSGSINHYQMEKRYFHKLGNIIWIHLSVSLVRDDHNQPVHFVAHIEDITQHKIQVAEIEHLAYHDTLTNLPNRRVVLDGLNQAMLRAQREKNMISVLMLDIDHFKTINDTLGHDCGDSVITMTANNLSSCIRKTDTLGRQGGDEFVIVLSEIKSRTDVISVVKKIMEAFASPFQIDGQSIQVTLSIGISMYEIDSTDTLKELLKKADMALYEVKGAGRNGYRIYSDALENMK